MMEENGNRSPSVVGQTGDFLWQHPSQEEEPEMSPNHLLIVTVVHAFDTFVREGLHACDLHCLLVG